MIHVSAQTGQEIAQALRGGGEVSLKLHAEKCADRLLGNKSASGIVITAPRQSGKTTELLRYAEEKYPISQFAVVCINQESQQQIIHQHWMLFNPSQRLDRNTTKLLGDVVHVNPPLIITPDNISILLGRRFPVFVDEWNLLDDITQEDIIDSGRFVATVTS